MAITSRREIPITGIILTYNEKDKISKTIEHLMPHVSEVIVYDSQSEDETVQIAKERGARVIHSEWRNDFALARNAAMGYAKTDWTLFCDADESFSQDFFNLLPALVMQNSVDAFYAWRISVFDGEEKGRDYQPRLLRTKKCVWRGKIHEGIEVKGEFANLPKEFKMQHCHSMKKQLWSNLLYQNIINGKERPPETLGSEFHNGKWVTMKNDKNG